MEIWSKLGVNYYFGHLNLSTPIQCFEMSKLNVSADAQYVAKNMAFQGKKASLVPIAFLQHSRDLNKLSLGCGL